MPCLFCDQTPDTVNAVELVAAVQKMLTHHFQADVHDKSSTIWAVADLINSLDTAKKTIQEWSDRYNYIYKEYRALQEAVAKQQAATVNMTATRSIPAWEQRPRPRSNSQPFELPWGWQSKKDRFA